MADDDVVRSQIKGLRDLGVRLGLDDFGTGWSSLEYLSRLPVDILKIAQVFVDQIGTSTRATALVRAIVDLAHSLGLITVAEGVETEEQADRLRQMGCFLGQGWYFARELTVAEATDALRLVAHPALADGDDLTVPMRRACRRRCWPPRSSGPRRSCRRPVPRRTPRPTRSSCPCAPRTGSTASPSLASTASLGRAALGRGARSRPSWRARSPSRTSPPAPPPSRPPSPRSSRSTPARRRPDRVGHPADHPERPPRPVRRHRRPRRLVRRHQRGGTTTPSSTVDLTDRPRPGALHRHHPDHPAHQRHRRLVRRRVHPMPTPSVTSLAGATVTVTYTYVSDTRPPDPPTITAVARSLHRRPDPVDHLHRRGRRHHRVPAGHARPIRAPGRPAPARGPPT